MSRICMNCGIEIRWQPTLVDGKLYCCVGCSKGGPCTCDYEQLPRPSSNAALARRILKTPAPPQQAEERGCFYPTQGPLYTCEREGDACSG